MPSPYTLWLTPHDLNEFEAPSAEHDEREFRAHPVDVARARERVMEAARRVIDLAGPVAADVSVIRTSALRELKEALDATETGVKNA